MNTQNARSHRWPAACTLAALLTVLTFFAATPAHGQANPNPPGQMTFQGFLTDASTPPVPLGNASPENKTVIFKIYKSPQSTLPADVLWAEQQIVTIDKGYFSVILGEGSEVTGLPHSADLSSAFTGSDASDRWIGITVDGGEITPRNRFFPSPYAQLARRARVADSANALVNSGGATPVVTTQAGRMEVAGQLSINPGPLSVTGNATVTGNTILTGDATVTGKTTMAGDATASANFSATRVGVGAPASSIYPLTLGGGLANTKIALSDDGTSAYGLGFQTDQFRLHLGSQSGRFSFLNGPNATEVVTIGGDGQVGIGTTTSPASGTISLHVGGVDGRMMLAGAATGIWLDNPVTDWFIGRVGSASFNDFGIISGGTQRFTITTLGNVAINSTTSSDARFFVNGTGVQHTIGTHYSLTSSGGSGPHPGASINDVSIRGTHAVHALYFRALSDARIKSIQGRSDGSRDLETLNQIEITDYQYKDTFSKGSRPHKKVIGQQVEEVFPQAVVRSVDVVPDIYQKVPTKNGWVDLATDLKKGDRVRLISKIHDGTYEVLEVTSNKFRTEFVSEEDSVFVYGREVKDFRVVDYEALSMLNLSATQELARRMEALRKSEARMAELEAKAARVDSLEREMAEMKKLVAALAQGQAERQVAAQNSGTTAGE